MKEEFIWETKDGQEIPVSQLTDGHLLNILRFIKRKAKEGITNSYIMDIDIPDVIFEEELYGQEVLDFFNYKELEKEAKKRGLI